jgi:hypothetical protein
VRKPTIDEVWARLKRIQGEEFRTKTGQPFTYVVSGRVFRPSRTTYNISRADFQKALARVPFDGPGVIRDTVRGPAYVWAVLHDKRVMTQRRVRSLKSTAASRLRGTLSRVLAVARSLASRGRGRSRKK